MMRMKVAVKAVAKTTTLGRMPDIITVGPCTPIRSAFFDGGAAEANLFWKIKPERMRVSITTVDELDTLRK